MNRTWLNQFGAEYQIPQAILNLPGLVDLSWGNDSCPRFTLKRYDQGSDEPLLSLWVEHPDRTLREVDCANRYLVTTDDSQVIYDGDDINEALKAFQSMPGIILNTTPL